MQVSHYTCLQNLTNIVKTDGLHFYMSRFTDIDEPHELAYAFNVLESHRLLSGREDDEKFYPYILSMSKNLDNLIMWRLFGDLCEGVCLVMEASDFEIIGSRHHSQTDASPELFGNDVYYGDDDIDKIRQLYRTLNDVGLHSNELVASFIKPKEFSIENEYRLCHVNNPQWNITRDNKSGNIDFGKTMEQLKNVLIRQQNKRLIRYIETVLDSKCLKKIIIGPKCNECNIPIIRDYLRSINLTDVSVIKSKYPLANNTKMDY